MNMREAVARLAIMVAAAIAQLLIMEIARSVMMMAAATAMIKIQTMYGESVHQLMIFNESIFAAEFVENSISAFNIFLTQKPTSIYCNFYFDLEMNKIIFQW